MEPHWIDRIPWGDILEVAERVGVFGVAAACITFILNRWAQREQVRFSTLHGKRAEILGQLYQHMADAEKALESASDIQPAAHEARDRLQAFGEAANTFRSFAQSNRIWLPKNVQNPLDEYWGSLKRAGYAVSNWRLDKPTSVTYEDVVRETSQTLPAVRLQLDAAVRELLGDKP